MTGYLAALANRRLAMIMLLGFASGLPLALTGGTLQAWMTVEGVDLKSIGIITLVGLPYTWKFLWAPLMDRYVPPWLDRRRGWILAMQLSLVAAIAGMAMTNPKDALFTLALLAVLVAFLSASQDIVFDAYSTDAVKPAERGMSAALKVLGYRVAMLVSGGGALVLATGGEFFGITLPAGIGWRNTYLAMAALMGVGLVATLAAPRPLVEAVAPKSLDEAVLAPLKEFFSRPGAWLLLVLIVLYKLGDAFGLALSTAFMIRGVGFSAAEVGAVNKAMGLAATIVGVLAGGALMVKLGLYRSLLAFGILQALSNLMFMWLALAGRDYGLMVAAVAVENVCGGMGTTAFVALLMSLCDPRFTATQFALLSALATVGRVYVGPAAGYLTDPSGSGMAWAPFFFITFLASLPGLAMLVALRRTVAALDAPRG